MKTITFLAQTGIVDLMFKSIADKIVVLRQGHHAATLRRRETAMEEIVAHITGAKQRGYD